MPQMAPMSWLSLYLFFFIVFLLFNVLNYFCIFYSPSPSNKTNLKTNKHFMWKW
uniref:ATP synthase complex subunit 8 n=1 Tax=Chamaemyia juncorum TaxID=1979291 RepID=A0A1W5YKC0_9MUSC|nr:ATP synthase F0 subunit 8 [Chamaemyia juncorum]